MTLSPRAPDPLCARLIRETTIYFMELIDAKDREIAALKEHSGGVLFYRTVDNSSGITRYYIEFTDGDKFEVTHEGYDNLRGLINEWRKKGLIPDQGK